MKKTLLALATLALAAAADAAIVRYDFSVTVDTAGTPYSGLTYSGSFAYDDTTPSGIGAGGETLYELTDFSFVFDRSYALGDLAYGDAAFDGARFTGLDAAGTAIAFLPEIGGGAPYFAFDFGGGVAGTGSFTAAPRAAVPVPMTAALAAFALAGLAGLRRRR